MAAIYRPVTLAWIYGPWPVSRVLYWWAELVRPYWCSVPPEPLRLIHILLTTFRHTADGYDVNGYTYLNGCPVAPGGGGLLQRIATDPKTTKEINFYPDEIPARP